MLASVLPRCRFVNTLAVDLYGENALFRFPFGLSSDFDGSRIWVRFLESMRIFEHAVVGFESKCSSVALLRFHFRWCDATVLCFY